MSPVETVELTFHLLRSAFAAINVALERLRSHGAAAADDDCPCPGCC
jgi:hypothetical protein